MATLKLKYKYELVEDKGYYLGTIDPKSFASFGPVILGLGDISKETEYQQALAAIFDLEGFTDFTNQLDPHLVIPEYLSSFLKWLFANVSKEVLSNEKDGKVFLWCPLPFFAKFMGDGVLFLWDTSSFKSKQFGNLVLSLINICTSYQKQFLPQVAKMVSKPPSRLRCGIARGQVVSIGNGNDFVGACINVASRIQKLSRFSFAFSRRGFELEKQFSEQVAKRFQLIQTDIHGIGNKELVYVLRQEFDQLPEKARSQLLP